MKVPAFKGALEAQPEITVIQRAGFILDALGRTPLARCAAEALDGHRLHSIALAGGTAPDAPLDERWSVYGRLPARAHSGWRSRRPLRARTSWLIRATYPGRAARARLEDLTTDPLRSGPYKATRVIACNTNW